MQFFISMDIKEIKFFSFTSNFFFSFFFSISLSYHYMCTSRLVILYFYFYYILLYFYIIFLVFYFCISFSGPSSAEFFIRSMFYQPRPSLSVESRAILSLLSCFKRHDNKNNIFSTSFPVDI